MKVTTQLDTIQQPLTSGDDLALLPGVDIARRNGTRMVRRQPAEMSALDVKQFHLERTSALDWLLRIK